MLREQQGGGAGRPPLMRTGSGASRVASGSVGGAGPHGAAAAAAWRVDTSHGRASATADVSAHSRHVTARGASSPHLAHASSLRVATPSHSILHPLGRAGSMVRCRELSTTRLERLEDFVVQVSLPV